MTGIESALPVPPPPTVGAVVTSSDKGPWKTTPVPSVLAYSASIAYRPMAGGVNVSVATPLVTTAWPISVPAFVKTTVLPAGAEGNGALSV
ncbi:hypothetical protein [Nocardia tengchongensis]